MAPRGGDILENITLLCYDLTFLSLPLILHDPQEKGWDLPVVWKEFSTVLITDKVQREKTAYHQEK